MRWNPLSRFYRRPAARRPAARPRFRPCLEGFEERVVPNAVNWIAVGGGDFNNPANWKDATTNLNHVPGPGDDANITLGVGNQVTVSGAITVNSLDLLGGCQLVVNNGGSLTMNNNPSSGQDFSQIGALTLNAGGSLTFAAGSTNLSNAVLSGTINLNGGSLSLFGTSTINTGASLAGSGTYELASGTFTVAGSVNAPTTFTQTGGALTGAGSWTVASGETYTWSGGSQSGTGQTVIDGGAALAITGPVTLDGRTLTNNGAVTWSGTAGMNWFNGATFANNGTFTITNDQIIHGGGVAAVLNNDGTITKTGATPSGETRIDIQVNNLTGSSIVANMGELNFDGGGTSSGSFGATANGTITFSGGTYVFNPGTTTTGTGNYRLENGALTVNGTVGTAKFTQTGGTLNGTGTHVITSALTWSGGAQGGTGQTSVAAAATLLINGPVTLDARTLTNNGTGTWSGNAGMNWFNGATFANAGTFTITNDQVVHGGGVLAKLNNTGTVNKNGATPSGVTRIDLPVNNNAGGTVTATTGELHLNNGGTGVGSFTTAANGTLSFTGGTSTMNAGASAGGTGLFELTDGALLVNTAVSMGKFTQTGGTLGGAGTLTVTSALTWSGGAQAGAGSTLVTAAATLAITGPVTLDARTLTNNGSATWSGTAGMNWFNSATFANAGTFTITNDQIVHGGGTLARLNNTGVVNKNGASPTGVTRFDVPVNNTGGVVAASNGVLDVSGGGTGAGTFNSTANGTLLFDSNYTLNAGTAFTGAGTPRLNSGTLTVAGAVSAVRFAVDGGTLGGPGTLTNTAVFTWTGGTIANTNGLLNLPAGSVLNISGNANKALSGGTLNVFGTANWTDAGNIALSNAVISVKAGGLFKFLNDADLTGSGVFSNAGTVTKAAGLSVMTHVAGGVSFTNSGALTVLGGMLHLAGNYNQTAGTTTVNPGAILGADGKVNVSGGTLAGSGTVESDVVVTGTGLVRPGLAATTGILTIDGSYTQGATATLSLRVGGATAGAQHDVLRVLGPAALNGTLDVNLINAFVPAQGAAFAVLPYTSRAGDFTTKDLPTFGTGLTLDTQYGLTSMRLMTVAAVTQQTFVLGGDDKIYALKYDAAGKPVGGYTAVGAGTFQTFEVGRDASNNTMLFAQGTDGQVYTLKFNAAGVPQGSFTLAAPGAVKALAVGADASNNPELFVIGGDNQVRGLKFTAAGNPVGGYFLAAAGTVKSIEVGHDANNNPELFAIRTDDTLAGLKFNAAGTPVGGYFQIGTGTVKSITVGNDALNKPLLFCVGGDDQIYRVKFDAAGTPVTGFVLTLPGKVKDIQVTNDGFDNPLLFCIGLDSQVYTVKFDADGDVRSGFLLTRLGAYQAIDLAFTRQGDPELFAQGTDNQVYGQLFDVFGNSDSAYFLTAPGQVQLFRATR